MIGISIAQLWAGILLFLSGGTLIYETPTDSAVLGVVCIVTGLVLVWKSINRIDPPLGV